MSMSYDELVAFVAEHKNDPNFENILRDKFPGKSYAEIIEYIKESTVKATMDSLTDLAKKRSYEQLKETMQKFLDLTSELDTKKFRPIINDIVDMAYSRYVYLTSRRV